MSSLGELQQMTLLAVARLGDDAFGGAVRDELARCAGRKVAIATVYVTLVRLEEQGYVSSWREGSKSTGHPGRPRRYFALTPAAITALEHSRRALARLWEGVELR